MRDPAVAEIIRNSECDIQEIRPEQAKKSSEDNYDSKENYKHPLCFIHLKSPCSFCLLPFFCHIPVDIGNITLPVAEIKLMSARMDIDTDCLTHDGCIERYIVITAVRDNLHLIPVPPDCFGKLWFKAPEPEKIETQSIPSTQSRKSLFRKLFGIFNPKNVHP